MEDWKRLKAVKRIFKEPNSPTPNEFESLMEDFKQASTEETIKKLRGGELVIGVNS